MEGKGHTYASNAIPTTGYVQQQGDRTLQQQHPPPPPSDQQQGYSTQQQYDGYPIYNYGYLPQYSLQYYQSYPAAGPVAVYQMSPPLQAQTSPVVSPYFGPGSPQAFPYPASPSSGQPPQSPPATAVVLVPSPTMQPYVYPYVQPASVHSSPSFSSSATSAPNSPPFRYPPESSPINKPAANLDQQQGIRQPSTHPSSPPLPHVLQQQQQQHPQAQSQQQQQQQQMQQILNQYPQHNDPYYNPLHITNIYIRGLPPSTTDESFYNMCCAYGKINSSKAIIDLKNGNCKGYGFVMYETEEEARKAIEALNQMGFQVSFARDSFGLRMRGMQEFGSTNIHLSNLPLDMDEQKLEEMLLPYKTEKCQVFRHPETNVSRGIGWAKMSDRQSAEACIAKFNNSIIKGSNGPLQVRFADPETQKKSKTQGTKKQKAWRISQYGPQFSPLAPDQGPLTPETVLGIGVTQAQQDTTSNPAPPPGAGATGYYPTVAAGYPPYYAIPAASGYPIRPIFFTPPLHYQHYSSSVSDDASSLNLDSSGRTTPTSSDTGLGGEYEDGDAEEEEEEDISAVVERKLFIGEDPREHERERDEDKKGDKEEKKEKS
ncbi:uncharacterized protein VTP21DRAFT_10519 [Calcarisporiella thermophila]|uniref:uncharacterized protein n=1 Tax=Calcarisporiella thermophila TaxID=911321 RepID=UPI003743D269